MKCFFGSLNYESFIFTPAYPINYSSTTIRKMTSWWICISFCLKWFINVSAPFLTFQYSYVNSQKAISTVKHRSFFSENKWKMLTSIMKKCMLYLQTDRTKEVKLIARLQRVWDAGNQTEMRMRQMDFGRAKGTLIKSKYLRRMPALLG